MTICYEYDHAKNIVHSYLIGVVGVRDLEDFVRRLLDDSEIAKGFVEMAHMQDIKVYGFSFDQAVDLPELFQRLIAEKGYAGSIFIAKNNYQYGMTRMFTALGDNSGLNLHIARGEDEAWQLLDQIRGGQDDQRIAQ